MDIVGGVRIVDGSEAKIVSGIDDHSRYVISARVVAWATAGPVCEAFEFAMGCHGVPDQVLTDNGIRHLLTAPRSPTTTGKIERWHKTMRGEFLTGKVFASIDDAQSQLDAWVRHYNHVRPHQSIGLVAPFERFRLAAAKDEPVSFDGPDVAVVSGPVTTRRVSRRGTISFATASYKAGTWLAGQTVEVVCDGGLVQLHHRGVLIATHARRHPIENQDRRLHETRGTSEPPSNPVRFIANVRVMCD